MMERSFLIDVKHKMSHWIAKIYAAQVVDGSRVVYERFIDELLSRITDPGDLIDVGYGPGHIYEL